MAKKVSERRVGLSVALTSEEREVFEELAKVKYHGIAGPSTVLREEALNSARSELARLKQEEATS